MGDIRDAYDSSVKASARIDKDLDAAAVEAGRAIADQIDYAVENLEGTDLTKALYLTPHLMNILAVLFATPKSRHDAGVGGEKAVGGALGKLQALKGGKAV